MKERQSGSEEQPRKVGSIEVITGGMFSGKTEEFIDRLRKAVKYGRHEVQIFTPKLDKRYGVGIVCSHDGTKLQAITVDEKRPELILGKIKEGTDIIAIDEGQFWGKKIVPVVKCLAEKGFRIIISGLDTDFRWEPFGSMPQLLAIADKVEKRVAYCDKCGKENATRTQRLIRARKSGNMVTRPANYRDPIVVVGGKKPLGKSVYEARCSGCHEVPGKPGSDRKKNR